MLPLTADKLADIRRGIIGLREKLNERAAAQIQAILVRVEGLHGAGPLPRIVKVAVALRQEGGTILDRKAGPRACRGRDRCPGWRRRHRIEA